MLTEDDIKLMKSTFENEIMTNRTVVAYLIREIEVPGDPYQGGGGTDEVTDEFPTSFVWTPVKATDDTTMVNGIKIESGDVTATVTTDIDLSDVVKVKYGNEVYRIMARSPLGIGEINRIELLLRTVI